MLCKVRKVVFKMREHNRLVGVRHQVVAVHPSGCLDDSHSMVTDCG